MPVWFAAVEKRGGQGSSNTKKRWRCRNRVCNGSLYTNNGQDNEDIVGLSSSHKDYCIPNPERRFVEEVISDLKVKVRTQLTPITVI